MKLRPCPARKVIRALESIGFGQERQKGSHLFLKHPDGRATVVPLHSREGIGRGLLRKIIRDTKMSREEFLRVLEKV